MKAEGGPQMAIETRQDDVPRLHCPTRAEFERDWVAPQRPVILTGALDHWKAFSAWTPEYLKQRLGETPLTYWVSRDGIFGVDPDRELEIEEMTLARFLDRLAAGPGPDGKRHYLRRHAMKALFSALRTDFEPPAYFDYRRLVSENLWIGAKGHITPVHYDLAHNLLIQVRGRKRLVLFRPEDADCLYPNRFFSYSPHFSQIPDLDTIDLERFSRYPGATPIACTLGPGEMLFLPACWWHQVWSLDEAISINYWWAPPLLERLTPLVLRSAGTPLYKAFRWLSGHRQRVVQA
jgi:lysine-specific demethylase 8